MFGVNKTEAGVTINTVGYKKGRLTESDKMFLLSALEVYGYISRTGESATDIDDNTYRWWFRSSGDNIGENIRAGLCGHDFSFGKVNLFMAMRPAFNLDTGKVLFIYNAAGGNNMGLIAVETEDINEWKLTLLDNNRNFTAKTVAKNGEVLTLAYENAVDDNNEDGLYHQYNISKELKAGTYYYVCKVTGHDINGNLVSTAYTDVVKVDVSAGKQEDSSNQNGGSTTEMENTKTDVPIENSPETGDVSGMGIGICYTMFMLAGFALCIILWKRGKMKL